MIATLVFLSPEFSGKAGHQAEYIALLARAAGEAGLTVRVVGSAASPPSVGGVEVERVLPVLEIGPAPSRLMDRVFARLKLERAVRARRAAYQALFRRGGEDHLWFLHTAPYPEIGLALDAFLAESRARLAVMMRSDHDDDPARTAQIQRMLRNAGHERVDLWADTVDLAKALGPLAPAPIHTVSPPSAGRTPAIERARGRVGVFGARRRQKGYLKLAPVIREAARAHAGLNFFIHGYFYAERRPDPEVNAAGAALATLGAQVHEDILSSDDLLEAIGSCEAVLMPYDPRVYRYGSSGVFVQAATLGCGVVVTRGSWMDSEAQRAGLTRVIGVDIDDAPAVAQALVRAVALGRAPFTPTASERRWIEAATPAAILARLVARSA